MRAQLHHVVLDDNGVPATGALISILSANTGNPAVGYSARSGGSVVSQPISTVHGRFDVFLDLGAYTISVNGAPIGMTSYTFQWDSIPADSVAIVPTALQTSNYTAQPGDFVPVSAVAASRVITLPSGAPDRSTVVVKMVATGGGHTTTITCAGSDVFNVAGGATSLVLALLYEAAVLQYQASAGIWYVFSDDMPLGQLDARYDAAGAASAAGAAATAAALQRSSNLSDLASASAARGNLGLGSAATMGATALAQTANNLSDLASTSAARTNLGLGSAAQQASSAFLQPANNLSEVTDADTARANLRVPSLRSAKTALVANTTLGGHIGSSLNGYTLVSGDRVLATAQTTPSQNGPWIVGAGAWTRPNDYPSGGVLTGRVILVDGGNSPGLWTMGSTASLTIDTDATTWHLVPDLTSTATQIFNGWVQAPALWASGVNGLSGGGFPGYNSSVGAPTSGTFIVGQMVPDANGQMWVCTASGAPGTWARGTRAFRIPHTWTVAGAVAAETGPTDITNYLLPFWVPLAAGQTAKVVGYKCSIGGGTNTTVKLQKNGADLTGFGTTASPITVTTTEAEAFPTAQSVASGDKLKLVVTGAGSGSPVNLAFSVYIDHTVA